MFYQMFLGCSVYVCACTYVFQKYDLFHTTFKKINFWLCWVVVALPGFSVVVSSGNYCLVVVPWLLIMVASLAVEHWPLAVWMGFSSCSGRAQQLWLNRSQLLLAWGNLPEPGIEPVSAALASGILSTVPIGKSLLEPLVYFSTFPSILLFIYLFLILLFKTALT